MLPIFLAGNVDIVVVLLIIVYKIIVAIAAGFVIDLALKLLGKDEVKRNIDDMCDEEGCHCERGIFLSALHHTVTVWLWCLAVILALNSLVFFVGTEHLAAIVPDIPVISHLICAVIGLIPNCAASVALSELALSGVISVGEMMAGLFSAAGVGLFVLFKMNKSKRENWLVVLLVLLVGTVFGAVADLIPVFKL